MLENGFFDWFQYWAAQLIDLVDSIKAWYEHFFAA